MGTVIRLAIISHLTLASVCACAQPMDLAPKPRDSNDPMAQEIKRLVTDQSACFRKEALSKSIAKADLETAAYAVVARCVVQTERYKRTRQHTIPAALLNSSRVGARKSDRTSTM